MRPVITLGILGLFIALSTYFVLDLVKGSQKGETYSRTVILYSSDGKEIRRWVSLGTVYCYNNSFRFYDKYSEKENRVQISGTVVVE